MRIIVYIKEGENNYEEGNSTSIKLNTVDFIVGRLRRKKE
jgi:hypothetical protein